MLKKIIILIAILTSLILIPIITFNMYRNHLNTKFENMAFSFYYSKKNIIVKLQNFIEKQINNNPKIITVSIIRNIENYDYAVIRINSNENKYIDFFRFKLSDALNKTQLKNTIIKDDFNRDLDSLFNKSKLDLSEVLEIVNLMNNNDITSIDNDTGFGKVDVISERVSIIRIPKGKKFLNSTESPSALKKIEGEYYYFFCSYCD